MSRSKFFILAALVLLIAAPSGAVFAQEAESAAVGTAVISDSVSLSDSITYSLTNVTAPENGTSLVGWLIDDRDGTKLNTGLMTVEEDGTVSHTFGVDNDRYTGDNLIHKYNRIAITIEVGNVSQPAGTQVFEDAIETGAITHIRHLVSESPSGSQAGIFSNLKTQLELAIDHASLANRSDSLESVQLHARHVINLLEGTDGSNFNADAGTPSGGDGTGVLKHASGRSHAALAAAGFAADDPVTVNAALVEITAANAETSAIAARDAALSVVSQTDRTLAKVYLAPVLGHLEQALNGRDADADGTIASVNGEGAAVNAYIDAQRMATYSFAAGAKAPAVSAIAPATGGDPAMLRVLAQIALLASVLLLAIGGTFVLRRFRALTS